MPTGLWAALARSWTAPWRAPSFWGAYAAGAQVAVLRVVTDGAVFAWLCDVYVEPAHRGRGVGSALVAAAVADLEGRGVRRMLLATRDAHEVYAAHGFTSLADPGMWMERDRRDLRPSRLTPES
ncbi:MAG: GNAT family N-acetyltransferase [Dermatophilaceae bacterium]